MKRLKMLGLAATVALAVISFVGAGTAAATVLYSGATKLGEGTELSGTLTGTMVLSTTDGVTLDTCITGGIQGKLTNAGSATETVKATAAASGITWGTCTVPIKTLAGGTMEFHYTSGLNGIVTASGMEFTVSTAVFGSCAFTFGAGTTLGSFTGSTSTNGVLHTNAIVTRTSGLCPSDVRMVVTFKTTKPLPLHITAN